MVELLIKNKDWLVPLATLLCAAFGGWWAGKKRIGIEVLSKNRQERLIDLRNSFNKFFIITNKIKFEFKQGITKGYINLELISELYLEVEAIANYIKLLLSQDEDIHSEFEDYNKKYSDILINFEKILKFYAKNSKSLSEKEKKSILKSLKHYFENLEILNEDLITKLRKKITFENKMIAKLIGL